MRKTLLLRLLAVTVACAASAAPVREAPVDGYAAIVNDRVITVGDVMELIQPTEIQLRDAYDGAELEAKRDEAYQTGRDLLIEQALILEEFEKQGGQIPERLVNDRINEFVFERFQNDRARFLAALAEEQVTLDEWRERIRERIIVSVLRRQEVFDKVKVPPGAIMERYEQKRDQFRQPARVKLSLIVLKKEGGEEAQREKAVLARGRILGGGDFAEEARRISEDSKSSSGGDWGWMEPASLRAELKAAAETAPIGQVSDVIETPDAFYLMYVEDRQKAALRPLDDVRAEIEDGLRKAESERLYRQWIERLKRKHYVQLFN